MSKYTTEDYEEAKVEAFKDNLLDEMRDMDIEEMDEDFFSDFILNFTFMEEGDWMAEQYESEADDYGDAKYEEWKDDNK